MARRPLMLDLCCGEGGAGKGYHDAGFDVVGVDSEPQPRYPFEFIKADATTFPLAGFDAVHASPPCNDHSDLAARVGKHGTGWILHHMIRRLETAGLPYVVENVESADMPGSLVLCGSEFGLGAAGRVLKRHRRFASNVWLMGAGGCKHPRGQKIGGVYGTGGGGQMTRGYKFKPAEAREAMGIWWASREGLAQAIPPAYTRFIGEQLLDRMGYAHDQRYAGIAGATRRDA